MANDLNVVQAQSDRLGKYVLILTNEQLKELGKAGAMAIEAKGNTAEDD